MSKIALLVAACHHVPSGGDDDGAGDPPCDVPAGTPAWAEIVPPGRDGALAGAAGAVIALGGGEAFNQISTDGGATWQQPRNPGPQDAGPLYSPIAAMLVDPRAPGAMWVPQDDGADGHAYRRIVDADFSPTGLGWPVAADFVSGGELHDACDVPSSCRLERRAPDGTTTTLYEGRTLAIATFASEPQRILTIADTAYDRGRVDVSVDGGATWSPSTLTGDATSTLARGAGALEVWAATAGTVAYSTDGGATWTSSARAAAQLLPDPETGGVALLRGHDGTISITIDGNQTWTALDTPFTVDAVAITDDGVLINTPAGLFVQDGGGWRPIDAPLYTAFLEGFARTDDALLTEGRISWRTTDEGATWTPLEGYRSFVVAPSDPDVVYARTPGEWQRSTDGGETWAARAGNATVVTVGADPDLVYGTITVLDEDVGRAVLARSRDGGDTFEALDAPVDAFYRIRADPLDERRVYVLGPEMVLRSDDQGDHWTVIGDDVWGPFPDRATPGRVWRYYAGALARSDDAGDTWVGVSGGPSDIQTFVVDPHGGVVVFTRAREVWRVTDPNAWELVGQTPITVGAANVGACPGTLTISADPDQGHVDRVFVTRTYGTAP